jgi:3-oxoacyl-[acyl-carrier-protein] synthase III
MIGINYIDYYIPEEELPMTTFLESLPPQAIPGGFKDKQEYAAFIENILKLKSIRVETRTDEASMIGRVLEKLFATQPIKPEQIDIIMATQEPGYLTQPNVARMLQHKYKLANAYVVHVNGNHCANIEMAVHLAHSLLHSHQQLNNILIVTSNKAETLAKRVFGGYAIVGDAAGILLVTRNPVGEGKYHLRLYDHVFLSTAALYNANVNDDNSIAHCLSYVKCISALIKKNAINDSHIEKILFQNANPLMITQCMASAGLDKKKIFSKNVGKYGHMDYVDFTINLKDLLDEGTLNKSRYILTFGTGHAGSYVSCLFKPGLSDF